MVLVSTNIFRIHIISTKPDDQKNRYFVTSPPGLLFEVGIQLKSLSLSVGCQISLGNHLVLISFSLQFFTAMQVFSRWTKLFFSICRKQRDFIYRCINVGWKPITCQCNHMMTSITYTPLLFVIISMRSLKTTKCMAKQQQPMLLYVIFPVFANQQVIPENIIAVVELNTKDVVRSMIKMKTIIITTKSKRGCS